MKILGIFRGFPGLGRIVGGVSILETLRDKYGFKVKAVSYLQGNKYLKTRGFETLRDVTSFDYCSIGLLPTNHFAKEINELIKEFVPDIIIIDGEPLIIQSLRISYPKVKIVTLLNPSDVDNEDIDTEAMDYFNASYQLADLAIVHGSRIVYNKRAYKNLISIPTIIRSEITKVQRHPNNIIYCILGGGTLNVGKQFLDSTVQIGLLCIMAASIVSEYKFIILCSCTEVYDVLSSQEHSSNVFIEKEIINAVDYYKNASMVITRSGRNTLGEVAFLGIPTIAFVSGCEYRRTEQLKNIESIDADNIHCVSNDVSADDFATLIRQYIKNQHGLRTVNGAQLAIDAILNFYSDYHDLNIYNSCEWYYGLENTRNIKDTQIKKLESERLKYAVFRENIKIILESGYLNTKGEWISLDTKNSLSELYQSELPSVSQNQRYETMISVINEESIEAGLKLKEQGFNPIVWNITCEDGFGGGGIDGYYGQDESLFRRTDLYLHTFRYTRYAQVFGVSESETKYPFNRYFGTVYVRNANVFRHKETMEYKLMDNPYKLSFVVVAAIKDPVIVDNMLSYKDIEKFCIKIRTIFRIGLLNNHDSFVLGSLGCGIFHNPSQSIVNCFDKVLNEPEFHNKFKKIVFCNS